ncbi:MAG: MFS transporter [Acidobacteria bacterium]|nr:MFS transporter [Acidobacteriota bacterium]
MKLSKVADWKRSSQETLNQADPRLRTALILAGVLTGLFLGALDQTIVATALPDIVKDLGGFERFGWVFTSFMLTSTSATPIAGKLSDLYGRKRTYLAGLGFFLAASVFCGVSSSMNQLIVSRGLQGVGAGAIMAATFASVGDIFPPAKRAKWMGILTAVYAVASVVGPLAGGYLTDSISWRWVFYVNLPIGMMGAVLLWWAMPPFVGSGVQHAIDYTGGALLIAGVTPMLLAFHNAGQSQPWLSPQVAGLLTVAVVLLWLFIRNERKAPEAIQPPFLFRDSIFVISAAEMLLVSAVFFSSLMFVPLFVQVSRGATATQAGMVLTPLILSITVSGALGGQIVSWTQRCRWVGVCGLAMATLGFFLLTRMEANPGNWTLVLILIVIGAGMGTIYPVYLISAQNAFPDRLLGVVSGSIFFFRSVGGAIGTAVFSIFLTMRFHTQLDRLLAERRDPSAEWLARLEDPLALLRQTGLSRVADSPNSLGNPEGVLPEALLQVLKQGINLALHDIFFLSMLVMAAAFLISFFMKEGQPRTSNSISSNSEVSPAVSDKESAGGLL